MSLDQIEQLQLTMAFYQLEKSDWTPAAADRAPSPQFNENCFTRRSDVESSRQREFRPSTTGSWIKKSGSSRQTSKRVFPARGEPGGLDDPLRRGLCGSRVKWYLRYLQAGLTPQEARKKALENRPNPKTKTAGGNEINQYWQSPSSMTGTGASRGSTEPPPKRNRDAFLSELDELGGLDDSLRNGLNDFKEKWYLRYLREGLTPYEARQKVLDTNHYPNIKSEGNNEINSYWQLHSNRTGTGTSSRSNEPPSKRNRNAFFPDLGEPGGRDDPLRIGLSGSRVKWYLRYLQDGLAPHEARAKALNNRPDPNTNTEGQRQRSYTASVSKFPLKSSEDRTKSRGQSTATRPHATGKDKKHEIRKGPAEGSVRITMIPCGYPNEILTKDELTLLHEALLDEVAKGWDHKLRFSGIHFRQGHLLVDCKNQETADWLLQVTPKLENWKGMTLRACVYEETPAMRKVTLFLPRSADSEVSKVLALIQAQNEDMNTQLWKVHSHSVESTGLLICVAVDEKSLDAIRRNGDRLDYRFGEIPVRYQKTKYTNESKEKSTEPPEGD